MTRKLVMILEIRDEKNNTINASEHLLAEEPDNNLDARELARVMKFFDHQTELETLLKSD
jgi:ABC-type ATPase involved in cell division